MRYLLILASLLFARPADALVRVVMEGTAASQFTVLIDTVNRRVDIDTNSYSGSVSNVGLFITSNVVIGSCVIYATGSLVNCGAIGTAGVTQLIAGTGISLSPSGGTGTVTVTSTGGTDFGPSTGTLSNVKGSTGTCTLPLVMVQSSSNNVVCAEPTNSLGQSNTALALAAAGTTCGTGFVSRGVDASGNCIPAAVDSSITGSTDPVQSLPVQTALAGKAPLNGTGANGTWNINTTGNAASASTVPAAGVQAGVASLVSGLGAQSQALNMGSFNINNLLAPSLPLDAANKAYVDSATLNIPTKSPARVIATSALPSNTYSNGSSGVGATLTGLSIGVLTVDGVALAPTDRVIVNGEATAANNGIYSVTTNSSLVVYVLTRAQDHDTPGEMGAGVALFVDSGTVNTKTQWVQIASVTTVGNSNSPVNFSQFSGSGGSWNGGTVTNPSTFTATVNVSTLIVTGIYGMPTVQVFSGTSPTVYYATNSPMNVWGAMPLQIVAEWVGAGGGGGGSSANGGFGGYSTFGVISAEGGGGGQQVGNSNVGQGGTGGSHGVGGTGVFLSSAIIRIPGGWGDTYSTGNGGGGGKSGGGTCMGPGAAPLNVGSFVGAGVDAMANTGAGGASAGATGSMFGGGGGECVKLTITNPASSYTWTPGTKGSGGSGGPGGNGGTPILIVHEYYR